MAKASLHGEVEDEVHEEPHEETCNAFVTAAGEHKEECVPPCRALCKASAFVHHVPEFVAHSGESVVRPQADLAPGDTLHRILLPSKLRQFVLLLLLPCVEFVVLRRCCVAGMQVNGDT